MLGHVLVQQQAASVILWVHILRLGSILMMMLPSLIASLFFIIVHWFLCVHQPAKGAFESSATGDTERSVGLLRVQEELAVHGATSAPGLGAPSFTSSPGRGRGGRVSSGYFNH
jgi:hypothetical protein